MAVLAGRARPAATGAVVAGVIRSFVAILLPDALRDRLAATIEELRPLGTAVAWVPPPNLHVTLQFLGPQTEERLDQAAAALEAAGARCAPLDLTVHGIGYRFAG